MNIAFEAFALSLDRVTGIGNVALKYIEELQKLDKKNNYFIYTRDELRHVTVHGKNWTHVKYMNRCKLVKLAIRDAWKLLREKQAQDPKMTRLAMILILRLAKMPFELLNRIFFPVWLAYSFKKNRIDVYFGTFADFFPLVFPSNIKKIWLIHDLVWKYYPETIQKWNPLSGWLIRRGMKRADMLLAVSDNTKKDVRDMLGINTRIATLYNAADGKVFYRAAPGQIARTKKKYVIKKKYILSVCTLEPRKNLSALLAAYGSMRDRDNYQLVLVGMSGWKNTGLFRTIMKHPAWSNIVITGYVPKQDLAPLYTGAEVFVSPTLYEGFGLPVLEAMQCGCPVVSSTSSSIPEVAGDACVLVDPQDIDKLASSMEMVLSDGGLRSSMRRKGIAQAKRFSWEKSATRLLEIFQSR